MAGRRRRKVASLIEINERANSVSERLGAAETELLLRINKIPHSPISFLEIDMTSEEMEWIDHQISHAIRDHSIEWALRKAPRMLLASLIGTAMRSDSDFAFWPEWAAALGIPAGAGRDSTIRKHITAMLGKAGLKTYADVDLGTKSHVARLRLHAGFSAAVLNYVVSLHEQRIADGEISLFDEAEGDYLVSHALHDSGAPNTLSRFCRAESEMATNLLMRIVEFVDHAAEHPEALETGGFSGTNSIPEVVFDELKGYLVHRGTGLSIDDSATSAIRAPQVLVDPLAGQLQLQVSLPPGVSSAVWNVSEGDHRSSYHQFAEASTGDQSFHTIRLRHASPFVSVELTDHGQSWDLDLFQPGSPVVFFSRDSGRLIRSNRRLQAGPVYALAPPQGHGSSLRTMGP